MKMMSNTSTTSTKGMMLISAHGFRRPAEAPPASPRPGLPQGDRHFLFAEVSLGHIEKFQRKVFHAGADLFDRMAEVVVGHGCGNGRE